ncbi:hypothetical protein [Phaeospirillum tilakii]|uniref:Uncharacterized protein n=1 Tax=Phaeospirillum tilakii TaxID=741673 RepID=A0ABW5CDA5_9PROT
MSNFAPPPTKYGPQPAQAKPDGGQRSVHAPPPTKFGSPPVQAKTAAPPPPSHPPPSGQSNPAEVIQPSRYFRSAAAAFGAMGAIGGGLIGGPIGGTLGKIVGTTFGGLVGGALPYAFDYYRSHQAQGYEDAHPGYHSVEKHSAWHSPDNVLGRTVKGAKIVGTKKSYESDMTNWNGDIVPYNKTSSQFSTDNWQLFSIKEGVKRLKLIDPGATFCAAKPASQSPGRQFYIKFTGWTTGFNYSQANKDGSSTEYVFYNFIKDKVTGEYFLIQHYPVPESDATASALTTYTVSTWQLI